MTNDAARTAEDNAREYRELSQQRGWPFALLVACSVQKDIGHGRPSENLTRETFSGKISASAFADIAGTSTPTILRHLKVWEDAAAAGQVTDPATLTPPDATTATVPDIPYPRVGGTDLTMMGDGERGRYERAAEEHDTTAAEVARVAKSPKALAAAITADAAAAQAARAALHKRDVASGSRVADHVRREFMIGDPRPLDREERERLDETERIAREREEEGAQDRERLLTPSAYLAAVTSLRRQMDDFVTAWSRRSFSLTDTEGNALEVETIAMHRAVDQINSMRQGHDDMDDALRAFMEERLA